MPPFEKAVAILIQTIKFNLRHQDYEYVRSVAKDYTIYATGKNIKDKLQRFNTRETEEMFAQRLNLTIVNTADLVNSCVKPLNKVARTPANKAFAWNGKDAKTTAENTRKLLEQAAKFWGKQSVEKYLEKRMVQFDKTDPNTFVIAEFQGETKPDAPKSIQIYPFEANSTEAINFLYDDNILQWLFVRNDLKIPDEKGTLQNGEIIYGYFENQTVVCSQIHYTMVENWKRVNGSFITIDNNVDLATLSSGKMYLLPTGEMTENKKNSERFYQVQIFDHNMGFVPAIRVGCNYDPDTDYRTVLPVIEPAKSYLEDSIQTMSEFSLTKRLHTFPQKFMYLPVCPGEPLKSCHRGVTPDNKTCKVCNGSGTIAHTSSQDLIGIKMPDDLKEMVSLENMMAYKGPPIELVKFQDEFGFDKTKARAISAVYNGNTFGTNKIVKTATENEIDMESVYDTIKDFADHYSEAYVFFITCIARVNNLDSGFECTHVFPNDFAMEPLDYLLGTLQKASTSGAPSYVKKAITNKINKKIYIDQPRELMKIDTKDKYLPFPGKTEQEVNFILASDLTTQYNKILHTHFDLIFSELEFDFSIKTPAIDFYELSEAVQRAAIKSKVNIMIAAIDNEEADRAAIALTGQVDEQSAEQTEEQAKAQLRGSIDGINGLLSVQQSVSSGATDFNSGKAILQLIYGYSDTEATKLLGDPKPPKIIKPEPVTQLN